MPFGDEPGNWNYGVCESCLKNAGDKIRMLRESIADGSGEFFVCPQCGSTKRL